jgi:hypothetical protein
LEVSTLETDRAIRVLKRVQEAGKLKLDEVALYGSTIHVVAAEGKQVQKSVRELLVREKIKVKHMEWIAPTLEDVFISTVKGRSK